MSVFVQQGLMLVLTVKVDDLRPNLPQDRYGHGLVVHPSLRAPLGEHLPLDVNDTVFRVNTQLGQTGQDNRILRKVDDQLDRGFGGSGSNELGVGSFTKAKLQRIDQQRLARAGLTGQSRKPVAKRNARFLNNCQILDVELGNHAASTTGFRAMRSFTRSHQAATSSPS